jgi:hypothetical protein
LLVNPTSTIKGHFSGLLGIDEKILMAVLEKVSEKTKPQMAQLGGESESPPMLSAKAVLHVQSKAVASHVQVKAAVTQVQSKKAASHHQHHITCTIQVSSNMRATQGGTSQGGIIQCGTIEGGTIQGGTIKGSTIKGGGTIQGSGTIQGACTIQGSGHSTQGIQGTSTNSKCSQKVSIRVGFTTNQINKSHNV